MVELDRLLLEQLVDVGVAAIGVSAALDVERFHSGRRIAERTAAAEDDVLQAFLGIRLEERGAFERPQPALDADFGKIVQERLGDIRIGRVAEEFAGVETVGVSRFRQQFLRLGRIVYR